MMRYVIRRILLVIPVLIGVSLVVFVLMNAIPGDPARVRAFATSSDQLDALRREMGLNDPIHVRYITWMNDIVQGDLGTSTANAAPVADILGPKLVNSGILTLSAMIFTMFIGFGVGLLAAIHRHSLFDRSIIMSTIVVASVPVFWFGLLLIWLFAVVLGWLPSGGMRSWTAQGSVALDLILHLLLPTLSAGAISAAVVARLVRSTLIDIFDQDYIRALRAKGLSDRAVVNHGLRNALPPVVTITGLQVGFIMGGALFTEVVFSWPGIGAELFRSITSRDLPVVQAVILFLAVLFVLTNLMTDIVVAYVDPKIRRGVEGGAH